MRHYGRGAVRGGLAVPGLLGVLQAGADEAPR